MRVLACVVAVLCLSACGGSDGPTVVPPTATVTTVRGDSAVWSRAQDGNDVVTFTARNVGRAGQWRYAAWSDDAALGCGPDPTEIGCLPREFCRSAGTLINAGSRVRLSGQCPSTPRGILWVVIESQDGDSPAWQRTACLPVRGACPTVILPQR